MRTLRDLDLNLLLVLHALLRERRVAAVARQLELSQPAVSNALARLRRSFGDPLFVRTPEGMQPTPLAERLAEPVAAALGLLRDAFDERDGFDPAHSERRFTIAMTDVGEVYFMPVLAERCSALAPRVSVATVRAGAVDLPDELAAGRIDLAIGAFDDMPQSCMQRRLFEQDHLAMFRAGHPLGDGPVTLDAFRAARHLIVANPASPYDEIAVLLRQAGVTSDSTFAVPHFVAVPFIVSQSDLVVTVPRKLAERAAPPFGLRTVEVPLALPTLQTHVFWHRRYHRDAGNRWLRDLIGQLFAE
ncbi:LysR family transcriptional regulator [Chitinasiproducens palmae]|nr:LysR family transcriptional regulator [Chitinasiproducens palmae]